MADHCVYGGYPEYRRQVPPGPNPPTMSYIGAVTVTSQQINDLEGGLWYVNFNSSSFPNGEIRGQIIPVPEPSALALLAVGGTLAALLRRRKLRQ